MSSADFTIYTPGIGTLSYSLRSHFLWGELSSFSAANAIQDFFSFHQVPITANWAEAVWNEKFVWHFHTWPAVGIESQTFWSWVPTPYSLGHIRPLLVSILGKFPRCATYLPTYICMLQGLPAFKKIQLDRHTYTRICSDMFHRIHCMGTSI